MDDDEEFTHALKTVLRDLRAQCPVQPDIRKDDDDFRGVILYAPDGSGQGVYAEPDGRPAMLLAHVADQVQEWAVEALWGQGEPAVWPQCPSHPDTHPLAATVEEGDEADAVWVCPSTGDTAARIGELPVSESGEGVSGRAFRRGRGRGGRKRSRRGR
ncbi:hypothetical protein GCM10010306_054260 [Streptomyces umbrinus]|uniref:hypothetical protein n=1 Tax=Streptomyces umbrinus TaxID=67370 RepID=UPI0019968B92|nr:hypothetical protein [Streptomyces umbrinus]GHB53813.1 hypothetical protein GCM10010306_054260 [Streptomyces umbrinus]